MKKVIVSLLIAAVALSGVEFAAAKSSKGRGKGRPSASPSVDPSASPDPSTEPGRGRKCRRHNPRKPQGDCPVKKVKSTPTPTPTATATPSGDPVVTAADTKPGRGQPGRRCRRHNTRKPRGACPGKRGKAPKRGKRTRRGKATPTPIVTATPTAIATSTATQMP